MAVKVLVKSGAAALKKLLGLGREITPRAFRDEIVKLSPLRLDPKSAGGIRQAARRKARGYSEDVKWHGSSNLEKSVNKFRKGQYRKDVLGLHVGDANAALERGRMAKGSKLLEKMGDDMDRGVRELEAKGIRADHLDILRAENLVDKIRLKNLQRDIIGTTPPISETRSVNPFEDWRWNYFKRAKKTTVPHLKDQTGNWHMIPLHTRLGNQLRLPDVGMGASGGQWDSASDIVKAMRSAAYRGSGGLSTDAAQYQGYATSKALRKMGGLEKKDRAILKKLLATHEDDFARIDGARILPKLNDKGELIRYHRGDRVVYDWGSNPLSDKKGMALLKRTLKKAKINSIVYKNKFENRGQDSWILLDPRTQARSPNAEFLKRSGGITSGLLPLMQILRGQREE